MSSARWLREPADLRGGTVIRRLFLLALFAPFAAGAQTQQEYALRRTELAARLPDGVFVALGGHEPAQDYLSFYHAPSFYYLTGFNHPHAPLVMIKSEG